MANQYSQYGVNSRTKGLNGKRDEEALKNLKEIMKSYQNSTYFKNTYAQDKNILGFS